MTILLLRCEPGARLRDHSSTRPTFSSSDDHNDNNDSMTIIMTMAMTAMTMTMAMSLGDSCCSVASQEHGSETHSSTRPTFSSSGDHNDNDNNDSITMIMTILTMTRTAIIMAM